MDKPEEILKKAREAIPLTQAEIADKLGISARQYQNYENGEFPKFKDSVVKDIDKVLGTNLHEIIYAKKFPKGLDKSNGLQSSEPKIEIKASEKPKNYQEERLNNKNAYSPGMAALVPVRAQAGYARSFNNTDYLDKLDLYPILPGIDPRGAVWRYFEVEGDSMEPKLFETDLVLVSMVPYEDWHSIKSNEIYVLVTEDHVLIKKIILKNVDTYRQTVYSRLKSSEMFFACLVVGNKKNLIETFFSVNEANNGFSDPKLWECISHDSRFFGTLGGTLLNFCAI